MKHREVVDIKYLDIQRLSIKSLIRRHLGSISALCRTQEVRYKILSCKRLEVKKKEEKEIGMKRKGRTKDVVNLKD